MKENEPAVCFDLFYSGDIYIVFKTMCVCVCVWFADVSYIPEKVVVRPGENVTVYCVFNDHNVNASTALWILNFHQELDHSQYHPVNQWVSCNPLSLPGNLSIKFHEVKSNASNLGDLAFLKQVSQVTVRPSETGMYDVLRCTQKWTIPYSQIYVEGEPNKTSQGGSPRFYFFALMENDRKERGDTGAKEQRSHRR